MFDPELAQIRFGCGLARGQNGPANVQSMIATLQGRDVAARGYPIETFDEYRAALLKTGEIGKAAQKGSEKARRNRRQKTVRRMRDHRAEWFRANLLRRLSSADGFRERLTFFWADHFTAAGKNNLLQQLHAPYVEESIRANVTGRFADMLKAIARAPLMLTYLDQVQSAGPNSRAVRGGRLGGLNENFAREMLELHTVGVGGEYGQTDVRGLAELLTGLSFDVEKGFVFRPQLAEPNKARVLGRTYGGKKPKIADIDEALEDLASHPATARHLASTLAKHFVNDTPSDDMVSEMAVAYTANNGALVPVYEAMLAHDAAWSPAPGNVKQPIDFISSTLRALDLPERGVRRMKARQIQIAFAAPMILMGQRPHEPLGPDGWPEEDGAWITPQRLAARVQWAMTVPAHLRKDLPDPRDFVRDALGSRANKAVLFAAKAAESRVEGVGLVLSSPAFQRM